MDKELKKIVYDANIYLYKLNLAILTWGNVSQISEDRKYMAIKPSGVSYDKMTQDDIVVVDVETGKTISGNLNPSSDTKTHLEMYRNFPKMKAIVHTHSPFAVSWAQANKNIKSYGTTHADTFYNDILCTRQLTEKEINEDYELNTGKVIVETLKDKDYNACPAILVASHGPFAWGQNAFEAVNNALILEEVAKMATYSNINAKFLLSEIPNYLKDKHYNRKHGKDAYYGQKKKYSFNKNDIKYLYFDLDGTILNKDKMISEPTKSAFSILQQNKNYFCSIATGRHITAMKREIDLVKPKLPIIAMNGSAIFDNNLNLIYSEPLGNVAFDIIKKLIELKFTFFIYTDKKIYTNSTTSNYYKKLSKLIKSYDNPMWNYDVFKFENINDLNGEKIYKLLIYIDNKNDIEIFKNNFKPNDLFNVERSQDCLFDICSNKASKGQALKFLLDNKYIDSSENLIVFGDNENDISMFKTAKYSVALANAKDHVQQYATFTTDHVDKNGILEFVEKYLS